MGALAVLAETLADSASDEDPDVVRRLAGRARTRSFVRQLAQSVVIEQHARENDDATSDLRSHWRAHA